MCENFVQLIDFFFQLCLFIMTWITGVHQLVLLIGSRKTEH